MVPTLDREEIQDRITQAAKTASSPDKYLRKRKLGGESSLERRLKNRLGKHMKSEIAPKNGLENE